jgi:hypothetical protein
LVRDPWAHPDVIKTTLEDYLTQTFKWSIFAVLYIFILQFPVKTVCNYTFATK